MKSKKITVYSLIILTALPAAFFFQVLFCNKVFYLMDIGTEEVPNHVWYRNNFGSLWNPLLFTGQPHTANPQAYGFDPLHVMSLPFPEIWGYQIFVVWHFVVAAMGAFLLFRKWNVSAESSFVGALLFAYGGYFISAAHLPTILNTVAYGPWVLYAYSNLLQSTSRIRKILWTGITSVTLAAQWFGGEPQTLLLTLVLAGLLPLWLCPKNFFPATFYLGISFVISVLLSAVQAFPFIEFLNYSNRGFLLDSASAAKWSLSPSTLLSFLFPHRFVNTEIMRAWGYGFWEKEMPFIFSIHMGVSAILLSLIALSRRVYGSFFWGGIFIVGLLMSLGEHSFFYNLVFHLPPFSSFRFPEKYFLFCHLAVCFLAAAGLNSLLSQKPERRTAVYLVVMALIFSCCVWMIFGQSCINQIITGKNFWSIYSADQIKYLIIFSLLAFLFVFYIRNRKFLFFSLAGLLFVELFRAHFFVNPVCDRKLYQPSPCAQWLMKHARSLDDPYPRIISLDVHDPKKIHREEFLPANTAKRRRNLYRPVSMQFGINDIRSAYSLYHEGLDRFAGFFLKNRVKTLTMFGVEYIVAPYPIEDKNLVFQFLDRAPGYSVYLYKVKNPLPRVYLINNWHSYSSEEEFTKVFLDNSFNLFEKALVWKGETLPICVRENITKGVAEILRQHRNNDRIDIELYAEEKSLLVFLETHYPGWKVIVDRKPQRLEKVNGFFQGVFVEAGKHVVQFIYRPFSFIIGAAVSIVSWITVFFLIFFSYMYSGKKTFKSCRSSKSGNP
ncbi:MAG: YfhO family protein [Thermodesulfobacteriota bacterium]|jgi:hypothetical protein|nr:MAG: YfhO family protein [Thermodesulfobacteriota bacterium]